MSQKKPPEPVDPKPGARRKARALVEGSPAFRETAKPAKPRKGSIGKRSEVKDSHDRYANIEID